MGAEEILQATVQKNKELVVSISLIQTIDAAFKEVSAKWREKINSLEREIETLRSTMEKMNATMTQTNAVLGGHVGADGKGGDELKKYLAGWKELPVDGSNGKNGSVGADNKRDSQVVANNATDLYAMQVAEKRRQHR